MRRLMTLALFASTCVFNVYAQQPAKPATTTLDSAEMKRIFDADQAARQADGLAKIDWAIVNKQDAERRVAARQLLERGALHTGLDFEEAAFVFQHGDSGDDFLLGHSLALAALAKGRQSTLGIATATLDRYLQKTGRPQIYGTQLSKADSQPITQEPYNREAIPDTLRVELGAHTQLEQAEKLKKMNAESNNR